MNGSTITYYLAVESNWTSERGLRQLLDFPREDMATELKDWLDLDDAAVRAKLAKEFIALANHGGGVLLFGFAEIQSGWQASGKCPYNLERYGQDAINNILKRHAEPVFECMVHHLTSSSGTPHVVIDIPGGHIAPISARRSPKGSGLTDFTYYIRRPGPESAPPQNGREWEELIHRCVDNDYARQLEAFRRILSVVRSDPQLASAIGTNAHSIEEWTDTSMRRLRKS